MVLVDMDWGLACSMSATIASCVLVVVLAVGSLLVVDMRQTA